MNPTDRVSTCIRILGKAIVTTERTFAECWPTFTGGTVGNVAEHRLMTYEEMAAHFGIGVDGARMKAKRRKWRQVRNHPQDPVRIEVPAPFCLDRTPPNDIQRTSPNETAEHTHTHPNASERSGIDPMVDELRNQIAHERQQREADMARLIGQVAAERALWIERIDVAEIRAEAAEARWEATDQKLHQVLDRLLERQVGPAPDARSWWSRLFGVSKRSEIG